MTVVTNNVTEVAKNVTEVAKKFCGAKNVKINKICDRSSKKMLLEQKT